MGCVYVCGRVCSGFGGVSVQQVGVCGTVWSGFWGVIVQQVVCVCVCVEQFGVGFG